MPNLRFPAIVAVLTFLFIGLVTRNPPKIDPPTGDDMKAEIEKRLGIKFAASGTDLSSKGLPAGSSMQTNVGTPLEMKAVKPDAASITNVAPKTASVTNRTESANSRLEKAFDHQLKEYQESLGTFETNLFMQAAFVIFGIFMVFSKEEVFKVPVIDLELRRSWLYFVVPLSLLFLWLRFGFLLDTLIKARVYGWDLYRQMAGNSSALDLRSGAGLFEDSGFLDGWFVCFREPNEHLLDLKNAWLVKFIFPAVFATLLALNHACIVAVAHIGNARIQKALIGRRKLQTFLRWLPGIMVFLLFASHYLFYRGGHNPNWFQLVIAILTVLFMFGLVFSARTRHGIESDAMPDQPPYDVIWQDGELGIAEPNATSSTCTTTK